jgi:hypothetical protein
MNNSEALHPKVQSVVDQLTAKGLGSLYSIAVTHYDDCRSHAGATCDCGTNVELQEAIPQVSRLPEAMQQEVATFLRSGATGNYQVDVQHGVLRIKGDVERSADVVADALAALTNAINKQTISAIDTATAIREQTISLTAVLARDGKVTFARDNAGKIKNATIKDA